MKTPPLRALHLELSTMRIENLVDGVFAIAMTVLVLNLDVDKFVVGREAAPFHEVLLRMRPTLLHYVESFVILAAFWIKHHQQYHFIKRSDRDMLWINLLGLFFVSLVPFTTSAVGDWGDQRFAAMLFEGNMLVAGLVYAWHWRHATAGCRLVERDIDPRVVRFYARSNLVIPAVSVVAMGISFFDPRMGTAMLFLVPIVFFALRIF